MICRSSTAAAGCRVMVARRHAVSRLESSHAEPRPCRRSGCAGRRVRTVRCGVAGSRPSDPDRRNSTGKSLRGEPSRLAWSPDGATLYIQARDGVGAAAQLPALRGCGSPIRSFGHSTKSPSGRQSTGAQGDRGGPRDAVAADRRHRGRTRTRVAPFTGGFASAGASTGSETAASFTLAYVTLSYLGVEIGRWMTDEPKSGVTFGWGPAGSGATGVRRSSESPRADRQGAATPASCRRTECRPAAGMVAGRQLRRVPPEAGAVEVHGLARSPSCGPTRRLQ